MSVEKLNSKSRVNKPIIPFTQVCTKTIQEIDNLEAGFVWVYLLSKSEDWRVIKSHIKTKFKLGDSKIKQIFSYLHKHNLIAYRQVRSEDGRRISHNDIDILSGENFIKTDELSTGSIINPVETYTSRKRGTTKDINITKQKKNTERVKSPLLSLDEVDLKTLGEERSICEKKGVDFSTVFEKFKINQKKKKKKKFIREDFKIWCLNEKTSEEMVKNKIAHMSVTRSLVKEWGAGHPDYDRLHGARF